MVNYIDHFGHEITDNYHTCTCDRCERLRTIEHLTDIYYCLAVGIYDGKSDIESKVSADMETGTISGVPYVTIGTKSYTIQSSLRALKAVPADDLPKLAKHIARLGNDAHTDLLASRKISEWTSKYLDDHI
jgi:hypothetical protein